MIDGFLHTTTPIPTGLSAQCTSATSVLPCSSLLGLCSSKLSLKARQVASSCLLIYSSSRKIWLCFLSHTLKSGHSSEKNPARQSTDDVHCRRKRWFIVFWDRGGRRVKTGEILLNVGGDTWEIRIIVMTA